MPSSTLANEPVVKPTRLYLMRHGQVKGHDEKRLYGHNDVELTEEGIDQFDRLGERLKGERITAIYSSDLRRSQEGAKIIARGDKPLYEDSKGSPMYHRITKGY